MRLISKSAAKQFRKMILDRMDLRERRPIMWFLALAALATELKPSSWLLDQSESPVARFFEGGSGVWPASFGALIFCAGFFGLVSLGDFGGSDWLYCGLEGGIGSYLLKRTFTLA